MMIKKQLGVLAAAVAVASSANAAFDQGDAMLYAWNSANDNTYFVDLGVTGQDLKAGVAVNITDSGLATWLGSNTGATWSIFASVNEAAQVAGPPATASYQDRGVVGSSLSGTYIGSTGASSETARGTLNDWVATLSGGSASFGVDGIDPRAANVDRNGALFADSQISIGQASALFYGQASPVDNDGLSSASVTNQVGTAGSPSQSAALLTSDGSISANVSAVPVPAAAWLFGSALAGLLVARRNK